MLCILGMHSTDYLQQDACYWVYITCSACDMSTIATHIQIELPLSNFIAKGGGVLRTDTLLIKLAKFWRILYISHTIPNYIYTISKHI